MSPHRSASTHLFPFIPCCLSRSWLWQVLCESLLGDSWTRTHRTLCFAHGEVEQGSQRGLDLVLPTWHICCGGWAHILTRQGEQPGFPQYDKPGVRGTEAACWLHSHYDKSVCQNTHLVMRDSREGL